MKWGGGDYQVVKFSSKTIYEGDDINNYNNQAQSSIIFNGNASEYVKKFGFNGAVITSLYKHDFLTEHNLIFEKFSYREDLLFNIRCFTIPQARVMYTSNILYGYFVRHNSASRLLTKDRLLRAIKDFCGINKILSEDIIPRLSQLSDIVIGYSISIQKEAFLKLFHDRNLSLSELKELLRQQDITYLFPITSDNRLDAAKNWLLSHPVFFKTASWLYSKLR